MVVYSGGKAVRGPQGTGILVGRRDLIEAALANASPNQFITGFRLWKGVSPSEFRKQRARRF